MALILHVATTGSDAAEGSAREPLRTINRAAQVARPGDTVVVHAGVYREWVDPRRGGLSDQRRITYRAAEGERVVITGSEPVDGWEHVERTVWKSVVLNELFGDFNPFLEEVQGDWVVPVAGSSVKHLGEVYLNGRSFYEAASYAEVVNAETRTETRDHSTGTTVPVHDADGTRFVWHSEVGADTTTIWANFHGADPNVELVEINVRRSVFFPTRHHIDFITVQGFELAQAATPWAPPTADQPGLVGPNWAKGWIVEDNVIHDAKCSAISLGKEASTGHNFSTERGDKPGYQYQLESVFSALQIGWDKEHIGSHVVRGNTIYDCGQNGIVGHLGGVFSTIEDNHIYRIATKREFYGHEIGGIKLHAAIDVEIRHNRIHDTTLGVWLDWQTQGTRLSRNILYANNRDLFVEVSHGPYIVDHNVFGSPASIEVFSQGGAYINNLITGTVRISSVTDRSTPYHRPHSTLVAGFAITQGGDDRFIGNVFLAGDPAAAYGPDEDRVAPALYGTVGYNGHPTSIREYLERLADQPGGDHSRFAGLKQPVYMRDNVYAPGAVPFEREKDARRLDASLNVRVVDAADEVYLEIDSTALCSITGVGPVTGADLPRVRFADADFEDRDGAPARIDLDLLGRRKAAGQIYPPGPISTLKVGTDRVRIWSPKAANYGANVPVDSDHWKKHLIRIISFGETGAKEEA